MARSTTSPSGEKTTECITPVRLPSRTEITIKVHRYTGVADGPTVYVQAAQHGSEVNGVEVLRRLDALLDPTSLSGEVVVVPLAGPSSFDSVSHNVPRWFDGINDNMNRSWPGDAEGTPNQRLTAALWGRAREADAIVDLHTAAPDSLSHVIYYDDASKELAEAFGTEYLRELHADDIATYDDDGSRRPHHLRWLATAGVLAGIPSITPELSSHTALDESAVETGLTGVVNILRHLGLLDGPVEDNGRAVDEYESVTERAPRSGLFRPDPDLAVGDEVLANQRLGELYDPTTFDVLADVRASTEGILSNLRRRASTRAGDGLYTIVSPTDGE